MLRHVSTKSTMIFSRMKMLRWRTWTSTMSVNLIPKLLLEGAFSKILTFYNTHQP